MTIALQKCTACHTWQYPVRDLCRACLADSLVLADHSGNGRVLAETALHRSLDPSIAADLPLRIALVALDAGVRVIAFLNELIQSGRGDMPERLKQ